MSHQPLVPIDRESAEFLEWIFGELAKDNYYQQTLREAKERLEQFCQQPKDELLAQLKSKMIKGALEHGAPRHKVAAVKRELNGEYTDIIGWLLVERWNERRDRS